MDERFLNIVGRWGRVSAYTYNVDNTRDCLSLVASPIEYAEVIF